MRYLHDKKHFYIWTKFVKTLYRIWRACFQIPEVQNCAHFSTEKQLTDAILKIPEIFLNLKKIKIKLISFGFWTCFSINLINKLQVIMSFEKKRFCFYCKLDSDRLERLNKSLKTCGICKIAQYCGQECQKLDFPPGLIQFFVFIYVLESKVGDLPY